MFCRCKKTEFPKIRFVCRLSSARNRDDGTAFPVKAPLYEIKQSDLNGINSVEDMINWTEI